MKRLVVPLVAALLFSPPALGSPPLELLGAPSQPGSLTARSGPGSPASAYFHPAALLDSPAGFSAGTFGLYQRLTIDLQDRPDGVDVSSSIYDARQLNDDGSTSRLDHRPLPTEDLRHERGAANPSAQSLFFALGTVLPIIEDRLALGFFALLPGRPFQAQRPHYVDEREQYFSNSLHFELLGDRTELSAISLAVAIRTLDAVDIGLGLTMTSDGETTSPIFVPDAADQTRTFQNTEVEVSNRFVPQGSLAVRPHSSWTLSTTVHAPYQARVTGVSELQLWGYPYEEGQDALTQEFSFVYAYQPLRLALGARFAPEEGSLSGLSLHGEVLYQRWSNYLDRRGDAPSDPFRDTLTAAVGSTFSWGDQTFALDARFTPTPVPEQRGRTNYVDNHRVALAAGFSHRRVVAQRELDLSLSLQSHRLLERETQKSQNAPDPVFDEFPTSVDVRTGEEIPESAGFQTNNPGYPGYTSSGWLVGFGGQVTVHF